MTAVWWGEQAELVQDVDKWSLYSCPAWAPRPCSLPGLQPDVAPASSLSCPRWYMDAFPQSLGIIPTHLHTGGRRLKPLLPGYVTLPWPSRNFICEPRSNYSAQLCPCKGPSLSWIRKKPTLPSGASRGSPLSAKLLPLASWGSLGGGSTRRDLGWQSRKPAGERSALGGLRG